MMNGRDFFKMGQPSHERAKNILYHYFFVIFAFVRCLPLLRQTTNNKAFSYVALIFVITK